MLITALLFHPEALELYRAPRRNFSPCLLMRSRGSFQSRAGGRMNLDQDERPGRGGSAFPLPAVLPPGCPGGTEGMERAGAAGSVRGGGQERD